MVKETLVKSRHDVGKTRKERKIKEVKKGGNNGRKEIHCEGMEWEERGKRRITERERAKEGGNRKERKEGKNGREK